MSRAFKFDHQTGILSDERGPIATISSAHIGGHIIDTGQLIATLLTWHAQACEDTGTPFFAPLRESW